MKTLLGAGRMQAGEPYQVAGPVTDTGGTCWLCGGVVLGMKRAAPL